MKEPRKRATMWHATDLCKHCGSCVLFGKRGRLCPGKLSAEQIVWSPQGYGPARDIVAFTGGDIACKAEFYAEVAEKIKERTELWVLVETNGYGLTPKNLDMLSAVDSFWLDIKAYDEGIKNVKLGNIGVFARNEEELNTLLGILGEDSL